MTMIRRFFLGIFVILSFFMLAHCGSQEENTVIDAGVFGPSVSGDPGTFRGAGVITQGNEAFLLNGPMAQGRVGDILMQNEKVAILIQAPGRDPGVKPYGGVIIDAAYMPNGTRRDGFGSMIPVVNLTHSVDYERIEVLNGDPAQGNLTVRAIGKTKAWLYILAKTLLEHASLLASTPQVFFGDQFTPAYDPFKNIELLNGFNQEIITDYTLKVKESGGEDSAYVIVETLFRNDNPNEEIRFPVGTSLNPSGDIEPFIPGVGFAKNFSYDFITSVVASALYPEDPSRPSSYGFVYDVEQFKDEDGAHELATTLVVSGVIPVIPGEESITNLATFSPGEDPKINFSIPAGGKRIYRRYFVVGDGSVSSVTDEILKAVGVSRGTLSGKITDNSGAPAAGVRVAVLDSSNKPFTVALSDSEGNWSAQVPTGDNAKAAVFAQGPYTIKAYKEGYAIGSQAAVCTGNNCQLGASGTLTVNITQDGQPTFARVMVVGIDPSPPLACGLEGDNCILDDADGTFMDAGLTVDPYGVPVLLYQDNNGILYPRGHKRLVEGSNNQIRLEPGDYIVYGLGGPERSIFKQDITITNGGSVAVNGDITRVLPTPGYVCGDSHLHSIGSPDVGVLMQNRLRGVVAEGVDWIAGADHENIVNYAPVIKELGLENQIASFTAMELTALVQGHAIPFFLEHDPNDRMGGAYDYTVHPDNQGGAGPALVKSIGQSFQEIDEQNEGLQSFIVAHFMDAFLGAGIFGRVVTTTYFPETSPGDSYANPINFGLPPSTSGQAPYPYGTSPMVDYFDKANVFELAIGDDVTVFKGHLMETGLPTYFNLLNLLKNGKRYGATVGSDTHTWSKDPASWPRLCIKSSIDPKDGMGSFEELNNNKVELAENMNTGKMIISGGVFVEASLSQGGQSVGPGETLVNASGPVTLQVNLTSTEALPFDRARVYINTVPIPAKDDLSGPWEGIEGLGNSESFHSVTNALAHMPRYLMDPAVTFGTGGEEVLNVNLNDGVYSASFTYDIDLTEDFWVVVVADHTELPAFPHVPKMTTGPAEISPASFLDTVKNHPQLIGTTPAWGISNPIFSTSSSSAEDWRGLFADQSFLAD
ncbi:MAG: carboxypeptidase regulatory-like domain-containing protein [Deltaproteobacteria bacterium]|nr:carboxypeptidase regulatory-like domain-containing protein [Deltaproteobacteria bacterium]